MRCAPFAPFAACLSLAPCCADSGLVPSTEAPGIRVAPGTELKVFADFATRGVCSPTAISIDEQGRVMVAETWRFMDGRGIDDNRIRRHWIHDDIASQTTADRMAMYEKWYHKHPPGHYTRHSEKIRMLFDDDGDGVADRHTIFADKFNNPLDGTAAGIFSYNGDVYFACIPHIWLLNDTDGDGVADSRKSLQDGFGVRVSLSGHDLNGFAYGPDGRIYATIGDRGFNITTKEGRHYAYPGQGAVLRFDPDGSNMEVFHTGLRNPKEIAFDQFGNAVTVDNNSDQGDGSRIVYVMEGGDSGWRMGHQVLHSFHRTAGMEKRPINRWMRERMWQPRTEKNKRLQPAYILPPLMNLTSGPSGLTYHPGPGAYPGAPGHFLVCDYRGDGKHSGIHAFAVAPDGAGMKVTGNSMFNTGAAVTDVEYGYDGKVYVSDFIGGWHAHRGGRIYTLERKGAAGDATVSKTAELVQQDFSTLAAQRLAGLLTHPDMRVRLRAQFALADAQNTVALDRSVTVHQGNPVAQLHGIWGLGIIARKGDPRATARLVHHAHQGHPAEVRARIAQCLGEAAPAEKSVAALMRLLGDSSPRVQSFAAIALGKRKHGPAFHALLKLLEKNNNRDAYLRHACVMGLLGTASASKIATLKDHASPAVQLAAVLALRRHRSPEIAGFIGKSPAVTLEAIRAIHDLPVESARHKVAELLPRFANAPGEADEFTPMMQRRLVHSAFRVGGDSNIRALLAFIGSKNSTIDPDQRREAVRLLSLWNNPPKIDQSLGRWSPLPGRNNPNLTTILQQELPKLLSDAGPVTAELLALATRYHLKLDSMPPGRLLAIANDRSLTGEARAEALRRMAQDPPADFDTLLAKLSENNHPAVSAMALRLFVRRNPARSSARLIAATAPHQPVSLRQSAWELAGSLEKLDTPLADRLNRELAMLAAGKGDQHAALEILAAAEKHPQSAGALKRYKASLDAKDPLSPYLVTLHGGDRDRGEALFRSHPAAQCMRCHSAGEHHDVAMVGPGLAGVANRGDRAFLLQSLVAPNAKISEGFGKASAMPPMGPLLEKHEIRDLVEYLSTLK